MRKVEFHEKAFQEFTNWQTEDKAIFKRIVRIIEETRRDPFGGIGKPEPLKGSLSGKWSKRINDEHRLIYEVSEERISILACWGHYKM